MPTGPNGEKRPADPMAMSVRVARIATGEIEEVLPLRETELGRIAAEEAQRPTGQAEDGIIVVVVAEGSGLEPQR